MYVCLNIGTFSNRSFRDSSFSFLVSRFLFVGVCSQNMFTSYIYIFLYHPNMHAVYVTTRINKKEEAIK